MGVLVPIPNPIPDDEARKARFEMNESSNVNEFYGAVFEFGVEDAQISHTTLFSKFDYGNLFV